MFEILDGASGAGGDGRGGAGGAALTVRDRFASDADESARPRVEVRCCVGSGGTFALADVPFMACWIMPGDDVC
jgi:hypothetical protein